MSENGQNVNNNMLNVRWQNIHTEACENENKLRMRWFLQNRQRLLDNLEKDDVSEAVRKKLRELKKYHEQWKVEEPAIEHVQEDKAPSVRKVVIELDYMRPVDPSILEVLYKSGENHEARKNYLKKRHELKPEDRFYSTESTNWEYGWRLNDYPRIASSKVGRQLIVEQSFYRKNVSSLNREDDLSRTVQKINSKNYDK